MYDGQYMRRAIDLSSKALDTPGTEPFGAVIVRDGNIIGEGFNHAAAHFDPTAHGEVVAIRDACRKLECLDLEGAELYTSCEPCALCLAAMKVVGIAALYYASSLEECSRSFVPMGPPKGYSISSDHLRTEVGKRVRDGEMPAHQKMAPQALAVIDKWVSSQSQRSLI
jgi:tRNA(Arg) A34 adenosine deaminase TadA